MTTQLSESLSIREGRLFIEDRDVADLAEEFGTPLFIVSEQHLVSNLHEYQEAFSRHWPEGPVRIMAAIKATHDTLKALREGTPPSEIKGTASGDLLKQVTRDADYKRWMKEFLGG